MDSSFDPSIFNAPIQSDISLSSQTSVNQTYSSLQITDMSLKKLENPKSVMIISKAQDNYVIRLTQQLVYWLVMSSKNEENEIKASREIHIYIDGNLAQNPIFNYDKLLKIHPDFRRLLHFWTPQFCAETQGLYDLIDFIITLGGDGTVLYASWLFQNSPVPPVIPIHMGSLGFFTVFNFNYMFNILSRLLSTSKEDKKDGKDDKKDEDNKSDSSSNYPSYLNNFKCKASPFVGLENHRSISEEFYSEEKNKLCFNNRVRFECTVWRCAKRKGADDPELIAYKQKQRERKRIQLELDRIIPVKPAEKCEDVINQFKSEYKSDLDNKSEDLFAGPEEQKFENLTDIMAGGDNQLLLSHLAKQQLSYIHSPSFLNTSPSDNNFKDRYSRPVPTETFQILNDVVVDRGPSAYMSHMELYGNNRHLTTVQADGLVIATPTGSTAYSLSAGGPIVHPQVQTMIVTPICPHTLSFRPMLLPNDLELKIMVPKDSRNTAWASFDGRHRIELKQGDFITVTSSRYPMPTICLNGQSNDWYNSLRRCLKWNDRVRQKAFSSNDNYIPGPIPVNTLKAELDDAMKHIIENAAAMGANTANNSIINGEGSESVAFEDLQHPNSLHPLLYNAYDPNSRFSDNDLLYHSNLYSSTSLSQKSSDNLGAKISYHDIGFV
jgi:NAD kinase